MQCSLCGSEEHFQKFCSKGKGKGKSATGYTATASGSAEADLWQEMPGSRTYFQNPQSTQEAFTASIQYADGTFEELDDTSTILANYHANINPIPTASEEAKPIPQHLQKLWAFPWWVSKAYHTTVRLPNGKEGFLIDCGAIDHMAGSRWVKRAVSAAAANGQGSKWSSINPISVEGVGEGASQVDTRVQVPLCLVDGQQGDYSATVVGNEAKESDLPALYGLVGLRKQAAIIDCGNNRMIFPGPGGVKYTLSPGSRVYRLETAQSGHLLLPCCEWHAAKTTAAAAAAGPNLL